MVGVVLVLDFGRAERAERAERAVAEAMKKVTDPGTGESLDDLRWSNWFFQVTVLRQKAH